MSPYVHLRRDEPPHEVFSSVSCICIMDHGILCIALVNDKGIKNNLKLPDQVANEFGVISHWLTDVGFLLGGVGGIGMIVMLIQHNRQRRRNQSHEPSQP